MEAAGAELGFAADEIVPVRVDIAVAPYNIDALWAKIIELMPDAQRARLLRTLSDIKSASAWAAHLVAGRQRRPRHQGHVPQPERQRHDPDQQAGDGAQRHSAKAQARARASRPAPKQGAPSEAASGALRCAYDAWARASQVVADRPVRHCGAVVRLRRPARSIVPVLLAWVIATIVLPLVKWLQSAGSRACSRWCWSPWR